MYGFSRSTPARNDVEWCGFLRLQGKNGEAMERTLHDIGVMDHSGWVDWQTSTLTSTGAPAEVVFTAGQAGLCVTTEVDDPARDPAERLNKVCTLITDLGGNAPDAALRDVIAAAQCGAELTWGARLNILQNGRRRHTTLLAEIPAAAADLATLLMPSVSKSLYKIGDGLALTMLEYDSATGNVAIHGKITDATPHHLPPLAEIADVSPDTLALAIEGLTETTMSEALPDSRLGFSLAARSAGRPPALSIFLPASVLGADERISQRVLNCGGHRMTGYLALLDHLYPTADGPIHHGTIGLKARAAAMPLLYVTVAAPWQEPDAA